MAKRGQNPFVFQRIYETEIKGKAVMHLSFMAPHSIKNNIFLQYSLIRQIAKLIDELTGHLVPLPADLAQCKEICAKIINTGPKNKNIGRIVSRTGWYSTEGTQLDEFVLQTSTMTKRKNSQPQNVHSQYFSSQANTIKWYNGNEATWIEGLKIPCEASPYLIFAIAAGFSGPALPFFSSKTGLMFNFAGQSGSGKTTLLRIAQSVFQSCGNDDIAPLAATKIALEEQASNYNHLTLCLDEFGSVLSTRKAAASTIMDLAYSINEGKSKARWSGWQGGVEGRWQTTILTTAEHSLTSIMGPRNKHTGAMIRYIDIPIPSVDEGGIFSNFQTVNKSSSELITVVEQLIEKHYGIVIEYFIAELLNNNDARQSLEQNCNVFAEKLKEYAPHSQDRYREAFGRIYAVGILAAELNIAPFSKQQLSKAVIDIFKKSAAILDNDNAAHSNPKTHINNLIALGKDKKKCLPVRKGDNIKNSDGSYVAVRRIYKNVEQFFILPQALRDLLPVNTHNKIVHDLIHNGILLAGKNSNTQTLKINGLVTNTPRPSGYLIDWHKLIKFYEET